MNKSVVISIHGIHTKADDTDKWQNEFDHWLLENKEYDIIHIKHVYGWLGAINSWLAKTFDWISDTFKIPRWTRRTRIENFKKCLLEAYRKYSSYDIHILAHSFGTFIVSEALQEIAAKHTHVNFCSVTLVAGIISAHIKQNGYDKLLEKETVGALYVWASHSDSVVRSVAQWPFGHLGYWGLIRSNVIKDRISPVKKPYKKYRAFNHHFDNLQHSDYFKKADMFYPEVLWDIEQAEKWQRVRMRRRNGRINYDNGV